MAAGRPGAWVLRLQPLLEHPKRWALVKTYPAPSSARTAKQQLRSNAGVQEMGEWEFASRTAPDGKSGEVYARYLGPKREDAK